LKLQTAGVAVGFGVQAVLTILIAAASINFAFWFVALPFDYYANLQVARKFNGIDKKRQETGESAGTIIK
jgi:hypothetical protein